MTITKGLLLDKFKAFNEKYFDGKLAVPTFTFMFGKNALVGKYRNWGSGPVIYINKSVNLSEQDLDDVLVHEMIHYYVFSVLKKDPIFSHGFFFRTVRRKVAKKGLKVHISYSYLNPKKGVK